MTRWSSDPTFSRWPWQAPTGTSHSPEVKASDDVSQARSQRLLSDSQAALRHALALRQIQALHRIALHRSHFNPNQPRVPAGNPDGGQWTSAGASPSRSDPHVMSDATSGADWKPGARYATNQSGRGTIRVRIGGQWVEAEPGQAARLTVAEARAQDAIRRVRVVDPNWRPKPGAYGTGIESEIRKADDLYRDAQARIDELGQIGIGPGPFAGESIPARGPSRAFNAWEHREGIRIFSQSGCHTCGTFNPGTQSGNCILDHQPPIGWNPLGRSQRLFPHCLTCSLRQGGWIASRGANR